MSAKKVVPGVKKAKSSQGESSTKLVSQAANKKKQSKVVVGQKGKIPNPKLAIRNNLGTKSTSSPKDSVLWNSTRLASERTARKVDLKNRGEYERLDPAKMQKEESEADRQWKAKLRLKKAKSKKAKTERRRKWWFKVGRRWRVRFRHEWLHEDWVSEDSRLDSIHELEQLKYDPTSDHQCDDECKKPFGMTSRYKVEERKRMEEEDGAAEDGYEETGLFDCRGYYCPKKPECRYQPGKTTKKKKKPWVRRHPCITAIIVFVLLMLVALIAIGIALFVVFKQTHRADSNRHDTTDSTLRTSTMKTFTGKVDTFFNGVCLDEFPDARNASLSECFAGSSPRVDSCSNGGNCTRLSYRVNPIQPQNRFEDKTTYVWASANHTNGQLCKIDQNQLGVCSMTGECDQRYDSNDDKKWYEDAQWEDNCDVLNPCWEGDLVTTFDHPITREKCRKRNENCTVDEDAIIWIQHLYCKTGKNRTTVKVCPGLPIRLWVCKRCDNPSLPPRCTNSRTQELSVVQCTWTCNDRNTRQPVTQPATLSDGQECTGSDNLKGYCFKGQCLPVYGVVNGTDHPMTLEKCNEKKAQDESM